MKSPALILAFLPLIVFSVLARLLPAGSFGIAASVAALTAGAAILFDKPRRPPKIISVCSFILFAILAVLGATLNSDDQSWLATWGGAGFGVVLGIVILLLVPVIPFTEQFARKEVPQSEWGSPAFKRINLILSMAWGIAIALIGISRIVAAAADSHRAAEVGFGVVLPVFIILYMLKFSRDYPDRITHRNR